MASPIHCLDYNTTNPIFIKNITYGIGAANSRIGIVFQNSVTVCCNAVGEGLYLAIGIGDAKDIFEEQAVLCGVAALPKAVDYLFLGNLLDMGTNLFCRL